jgi:hypothetical protein
MFWKPRKGNKNYPLDLDAGLHHTRFAKTVTPTPYPPIIGAVRSVLPFQDILAISQVRARSPSGPGSTTSPTNNQWQTIIPGLSKFGEA